LGNDHQEFQSTGKHVLNDAVHRGRVPGVRPPGLELAPLELEANPPEAASLHSEAGIQVVALAVLVTTGCDVPAVGEIDGWHLWNRGFWLCCRRVSGRFSSRRRGGIRRYRAFGPASVTGRGCFTRLGRWRRILARRAGWS